MSNQNPHWCPTATIETLKQRAKLIHEIRAFFNARAFLEVETPLLSQHTVTDVHIESFAVPYYSHTYYLQTSPEYTMKRLLAAGSGSIFQITKAFRYESSGHLHNPEFTLLEWYHPGFSYQKFMQELDAFLQHVLNTPPATKITYRDLFLTALNIDPFTITFNELKTIVTHKVNLSTPINDINTGLQLLLSHCIEPKLGFKQPAIIYDFPASQAALAKIRTENGMQYGERFEVFINGIELANGFHELTNSQEQRERFKHDQQLRTQLNLPTIKMDDRLLGALEYLPDCCGVALGVDRLMMLALNQTHIDNVISFPLAYA